MTVDSIREHCLSLPHATEIMQWGDHVLFKVGGKMFCILSLEGPYVSFKCTHEDYADLVERADISPCSHNMWKYQWVTVESPSALYDSELRDLLATSHRLIFEKLPKKIRMGLEGTTTDGTKRRKRTA